MGAEKIRGQGFETPRRVLPFAPAILDRDRDVEPLRAPKRVLPERRGQDNSALWWVLVLALCVAGGIGYLHLAPSNLPVMAQGDAGMETIAPAGQSGFSMAGLGARKEFREESLQKAAALPAERFAGPVTYVTDNEACRSLRADSERIRASLRKSPPAAQKKELQLDLRSVKNRGTELGCWSTSTD